MTAHDDDQDLVTVRIPRRAAALYAAELDISAGSTMVLLNVYGQFAIGAAVLIVSVICWAIVAMNMRHGTYENLPIAIFGGLFTAAFGAGVIAWATVYRHALRRRGLLR